MKKYILLLFCCWYTIEALSFTRFLYRPKDDVRSFILQLIENERKSIKVAMYTLTDKHVLEYLIRAYLRGVKVEVVVDQISDAYAQKIKKLQENGIPVLVHRVTGYPIAIPLMHHKFFIFEQTCFEDAGKIVYVGPLLWMGSYNATEKAAVKNDESVMLSDDRVVLSDSLGCFRQLVKRLQ